MTEFQLQKNHENKFVQKKDGCLQLLGCLAIPATGRDLHRVQIY